MSESKKSDLFHFSPDELIPAPENNFIYDTYAPKAEADDNAFYFSVKEHGIKNPLIISADHFILSGHRRHAAAQWLALETVPCLVEREIIYADLSYDERLAALAEHNQQRDKSHAEKLREALLKINPDEAYEKLLRDRLDNQSDLVDNVPLGAVRNRKKITTIAFLKAVQIAIESERDYWPITDRRVHYLLLNNPPPRTDLNPKNKSKKAPEYYQNNRSSYQALTNLITRARLTGDIPEGAIEDESRPFYKVSTWQSPDAFIAERAGIIFNGYNRDILRGQQYHVEILVEKNALRTHVEKIAREYCIPCTTGKGYASLSPRWNLYSRFIASGKSQLIILVLSDFDPDGDEIAASFCRSLRDDFGLDSVIARKVLLSADDVREHNIPLDMEAKTSSRNYAKFVKRHGGIHVAELDACPVPLIQKKLREAIESCLDMDLLRAEEQIERNEDAAFIQANKMLVLDAMAGEVSSDRLQF
jgi:hypothetical protein